MRFDVVSEISGRLRLRCGALLFGEAEARGVALGLMGVEGVRHADVHPANGSILVVFDPRAREAILGYVRDLDPLALPAAQPGLDEASGAIEIAAENRRFCGEVARLVLMKAARRLLLPLPLRSAWVVVQALRFLGEALRRLARGELTVEVLDATAIWTSILRRSFSDADAVIFLLQLSDVIGRHVQSRTHLALMANMVTRPESVWAVVDGRDVLVDIDAVEKGMVIHVGLGSAMPVDGEVVKGEAEVDESSMTGESRVVHKEVGSTVFAGTAIESGDVYVRVIAEPGAARIDRIVSQVVESSDLKADAQGKAERLADGLVPYSFLAFFGVLALTRSMAKAMILLMVDYSCAIRFTTPVAVMSAMNEATRHDMVVKGGKFRTRFFVARPASRSTSPTASPERSSPRRGAATSCTTRSCTPRSSTSSRTASRPRSTASTSASAARTSSSTTRAWRDPTGSTRPSRPPVPRRRRSSWPRAGS